MTPKYEIEDVLKYGSERYYIIDIIKSFGDKDYYLCCEATLDAKLDFTNIAAFEIKYEENGEELIRMVDPDSEVYEQLLGYELTAVTDAIIPEFRDKLVEELNKEE